MVRRLDIAPEVYVVAAKSTADVATAVNFARTHDLRLVVKGGGHHLFFGTRRRGTPPGGGLARRGRFGAPCCAYALAPAFKFFSRP